MQRLSNFSIILIFVALSIVGLLFVPKLSVRLHPSAELPQLTVNFYYSGASPQAVTNMVIAKIEPEIAALSGIQKIKSYAFANSGSINISIDRTTDLDFFRYELSSIIRQIYPKLPKTVSYPKISAIQTQEDANPVLISYALSGKKAISKVSQYAQKYILPQITSVEGVKNTEITGANNALIEIRYKPQILARYGISNQDLQTKITDYYQITELGRTLEKNSKNEEFVRLSYKKDSTKDLWQLPITQKNGRIIRLGQIASIRRTETKPTQFFRINGKNTVNLNITAYKYANSLVVAQAVKQKIGQITKHLPAGFDLRLEYDSSRKIKKELNKIYRRTAFTILILLFFVFLIRLQWKYLVIILLSLITNISLAFALYYIFKIEIQLYSLAGITISLGFAIDNSLVIFEHIRTRENKRIFIAVLAATLTTIGALSGIYFLGDKLRLQLSDFASVIIINLAISLVVAYFYVPALTAMLYKNNPLKRYRPGYFRIILFINKSYRKLIQWQIRQKWISILFFVLLFGLPVYKLPQYVTGNSLWAKIYNTTIGSDFYDNNLRPYINKTLGGTLRLFNYYVFDNDFYGEKQEQILHIQARAPQGTTIEQLNSVFRQMESFLSTFPEIEQFITHIQSIRSANIEIHFTPKAQNSMFPYILKNRLAAFAFDLSATDWTIYGIGKTVYTGSYFSLPSYLISLKGYNYVVLNQKAQELSQFILRHPRVQEVDITSPLSYKSNAQSYHLEFSLPALLAKKRNVKAITQNLFDLSNKQTYNFAIYRKNKYQKIKLSAQLDQNFDFWQIKNRNIGNDSLFLRIKQVAKIIQKPIIPEIYRENQEFELYLRYNYVGSQKFGDKYLKKILKHAKQILPLGYHAQKKDSEWYFSWEKPQKPYILILLVAVIIYFITAILFESLYQPFVILMLIPVSFIGVFLTFYWFDLNFDMGGFASFIVLSGLTVNSGIYLINDFNNMQKNSSTNKKLLVYLRAFRHKIVPIFLTLFSTALGMLPFIWGGQNESFWFTLAAGTIGGLAFSLIGLIFLLPVLVVDKNNPPPLFNDTIFR